MSDHHADLAAAGAETVDGISAQDTAYRREAVERLGLPFSMLADPGFTLAAALDCRRSPPTGNGSTAGAP